MNLLIKKFELNYMPPQKFTARLEEKIQLNDKFINLQFELVEPHQMQFEAGQYVSIQVDEKGTRRSYSISSRPDVDHGFELLVDLEPQGLGVQFLDGLEFGQEISLLGPMGQFTIEDREDEKSLVFVATGSGIAPFMSMVTDLLQVKQDPRPIILYWGLRYAEQMFWQDEFAQLAESFSNFKFHPVLSKPTQGWVLCSGHVTDCLSIHDTLPDAGYYLCGNKGMIEDTIKVLTQMNVKTENIHHEKFY